MGYKVKWVEDNLGISRKALRNFEKVGLMPANVDGRHRDYSDEDIDRIWTIRIFQGIGYTLKELVELIKRDEVDFDDTLEKKIKELEEKKFEIERHLGYAQTIKFMGRIPMRPQELGTITFKEFYDKSLNEWNVNSDPEAKKYRELTELILNTPEEELEDTDVGQLISGLMNLQNHITDLDTLFIEKVLPNEILKRKDKGTSDVEVQLLVKMLYENRIKSIPDLVKMSQRQFVRFEVSSYTSGDIAKLHEKEYGKDGCIFIANAIAAFGGYDSWDEIED